jgi:hypothetical protein
MIEREAKALNIIGTRNISSCDNCEVLPSLND